MALGTEYKVLRVEYRVLGMQSVARGYSRRDSSLPTSVNGCSGDERFAVVDVASIWEMERESDLRTAAVDPLQPVVR